jgi:hypothetical protein
MNSARQKIRNLCDSLAKNVIKTFIGLATNARRFILFQLCSIPLETGSDIDLQKVYQCLLHESILPHSGETLGT